jgi:hypothetical protein
VGWLYANSASGQTISPTPASLGSTLTAELIADLPTADNLFLLLETTQPTLITDRFYGGGLYAGQGARIGGFLTSPTQTLFRIGDVAVTDPDGSGTPLLFPSLSFWSRVDVQTGTLDSDVDAPGLAISLQPLGPTSTWVRTIDASTSHFGTGQPSPFPAIARLQGFDRVTVSATGPLIRERLGFAGVGSWMRGAQFERAEPEAVTSQLASAFGHLLFTPTSDDEISTVGWIQRDERPFEYRLPFRQATATHDGTSGHVQSTWIHAPVGRVPLRMFAGYSRRYSHPHYEPTAGAVLERLVDGPVQPLANAGQKTTYRWSVGFRAGDPTIVSSENRHGFYAGVDVDGSGSRATFSTMAIRELVDGRPARVWEFVTPALGSFRHHIGLTAFAGDRLTLTPRVSLDVGVRYESVSAAAEGAATGITWRTLMPRAEFRWRLSDRSEPTLFAAYTEAAYRLPLDWLAIGDPAAPTATVFRAGGSSTISPLIARTGPGTGGRSDFSSIDPDLRRPRTSELAIGFEVEPLAGVRMRLLGLTRRESDRVGVANTGDVSYTISGLFDPGGNVLGPDDDRIVPIYDQRPETFGRDRYVLTNLDVEDSTFEGIELTAEVQRDQLTLLLGATAGRAYTAAASRGFGAIENDQGVLGELDANPNAATFARGRPFTDRAYTGKIAGIYRFRTATTVGLVARYQDGQPFSRMLVVSALNQGREAVRAFASGDSRFMFTGTLDARVRQRIALGSTAIDLVLDAYNLLGLEYSVEERTTEAPDVRVTTAVQPPRSLLAGVRLAF